MVWMKETIDILEYDGTLAGFYTVIDLSFRRHQFPAVVLNPTTTENNLFPPEWIKTDEKKAEKIARRLQEVLTPNNYVFLHDGFNTSLENKETYLLHALHIGLDTKDNLQNFIGKPEILALDTAVRALYGEAHQYKGFVRFEYVEDVLFAKITPKHYCLPYICPHFVKRYANEKVMIYDETHQLLACLENGSYRLLENITLPKDKFLQGNDIVGEQWRAFLAAVTIKERINPSAQRNHLPLRFRSEMTEFQ